MLNNKISSSSALDSILLKKTSMYSIVIFILFVLMFWIIMIFQNSSHSNSEDILSENI